MVFLVLMVPACFILISTILPPSDAITLVFNYTSLYVREYSTYGHVFDGVAFCGLSCVHALNYIDHYSWGIATTYN